ncbi:MAG: glycosyltransferase [Pyrinomonadaceae bacterium]|nr:glycosyltransferase [Pyrinomonadaceae bacterium]
MGKKVLHFIGSFHQGGSERQAVQLVSLLKENGQFEVHVATLNKSGVLLEEMAKAGFDQIEEYKLDSFFSLGFARQLWKAAGYMRKHEIDIVHTHDFYTNVFGIFAAKLAGVGIRIASKRETGGVRTKAQEKLERYAYRTSTAITVNAKAVKRYLEASGVDTSNTYVIYNGLDLARLKPGLKDREEICKKLGLPVSKRFVTLVANLRHGVKNQPMLLRSARFLKEEFTDVHFVFAGEGERKDFLVETAQKLGVGEISHFLDRCQIIPELLHVSEICVLTSYAEGFSNSILEYMAAGKPVVATDVGGAAESIEEGESGFLVQSDDSKEMADKLAIILADRELGEKFGRRGRQIVEGTFSTAKQLKSVVDLYESLLEDQ